MNEPTLSDLPIQEPAASRSAADVLPPDSEPVIPKEVPQPPAKDIGIRTMQGDIDAFKASGGVEVNPEFFQTATIRPQQPAETPSVDALLGVKEEVSAPSQAMRAIALSFLGFAVVAIGILAYYFAYPVVRDRLNLNQETAVPKTVDTTKSQVNTVKYAGLFAAAPKKVSLGQLANVNLAEIEAAVAKIADEAHVAETIESISLVNGTAEVTAPSMLNTLLPDLGARLVTQNFQDRFDMFLYTDTAPRAGYVFRVNDGTTGAVKNSISLAFEKSATRKNLFVTEPGTRKTKFVDDKSVAAGVTARAETYGAGDSVLVYGWSGNNFVISTSKGGFAAAVSMLGK